MRLTDVAAGVGRFSLAPATLDESFGLSLSVVGDIDNPGLPDLVVDAYDLRERLTRELQRCRTWRNT